VVEKEPVERVGRLLGNPVAHTLEHLEAVRTLDVTDRRLRCLAAERDVRGAPDVHRRRGDGTESVDGADVRGAVPVERGRQRAWLPHAPDVLVHVTAQPAPRQHRPQPSSVVLEQQLLGPALVAEHLDVAGALPLVVAGQRAGERDWMRNRHRGERAQPLRMTAGGVPRNRRAPVVTDQVEPVGAQPIGHADHVGHQGLGPVVLYSQRTGPG
jgi:hypothetical protein